MNLPAILKRNGGGNGKVAVSKLEYAELQEKVNRLERRTMAQEVGASGTQFFSGYIKSGEYNTKLKGSKAVGVYQEMRRSDSQVHASLMALKLPIMAANWAIECEDERIKEFLEDNLFHRVKWKQFLREALNMLDFGCYWFEKVYAFRDGKIHLDRLAPRLPSTINKWNREGGKLVSVEQFVWKDGAYHYIAIPREKIALFINAQEGDDYWGISVLRSAYAHWYVKSQLYKISAIAQERWGVGIPKGLYEEGTAEEDIEATQTMLKNLKSGEQSWITASKRWDIGTLEGPRNVPDPMPLIKHHDVMIARNVLAEFLNLGTTETGSRAVATEQLDLFMTSLQGVADEIKETVQQDVVDDLLRLNFPNPPEAKLTVSNIAKQNIETITKALQRLGEIGFIMPDDQIEEHLRKVMRLPEKEEEPEAAKARERKRHSHIALKEGQDFWREPTELEQTVALREIKGRLDDAKEEIVRVAGKVRKRQIEILIEDIKEALADGDPSDVADVSVQKVRALAEAIKPVLMDLYGYGWDSLWRERDKQLGRHRFQEGLAYDWETADQIFMARSLEASRAISEKIRASATSQALNRWRETGGEIPDAEWDDIFDEIMGLSDQQTRLTGGLMVNESYDMGRAYAAEEMREQIERAVYSAILDENVCSVCEAADGTEVALDDPEYQELMPPNKNCLGKTKCRCIWVYVFKEEQAAVT